MPRRKTKRALRDIDQPIACLSTHESPLITPKVLAAYLRCDVRTVLRMIEARAIRGFQVGREWRIHTESARRAFHVETHQTAS